MRPSFVETPDGRAWSYLTITRDVLPDGRTVGNVTKYSQTTSRHQTKAAVRSCDVLVDNVPRGTRSLAMFALTNAEIFGTCEDCGGVNFPNHGGASCHAREASS